MKLLYIDACVRAQSRSKILADYLLTGLCAQTTCTTTEVILPQLNLQPLNEQTLQHRTSMIAQNHFDDAMFALAKDFAAADLIVIVAPYWDLSFPSLLKLYIEHINVAKLVFRYGADGRPVSLCRAQKLCYITTKGGYNPDDFGYDYIKYLAHNFYQIPSVHLIKAEGLDIIGNDVDAILQQTKSEIDALITSLI
ncbi:MAG: NAD(P)H-dependent oxidoreductase [Alphaproteobacteria bacterium]|nr:NAD(P)H-dependent oxidoreductase [Alphaproteobacteria bacterium]